MRPWRPVAGETPDAGACTGPALRGPAGQGVRPRRPRPGVGLSRNMKARLMPRHGKGSPGTGAAAAPRRPDSGFVEEAPTA